MRRAVSIAVAAAWLGICAATAAAAEQREVPEIMPNEAPPVVRPEALDGERPLLALDTPVGVLAYAPGRGLRVGDTGLWLGGYAAADAVRDEGGPGEFSLEALSLFVVWTPTSRLRLFSELELEDPLVVDTEGDSTARAGFTVERLYGDAIASDALTVRGGKFLTPVGRWNVIHAAPLVWTTSRPLVTELPFDQHTTGAALLGTFFLGHDTLSYTVYGQPAGSFDEVDQPQVADHSVGARLEWDRGADLSLGSSYLAFERHGVWRNAVGLDALWARGPLEVMSELLVERSPHGGRDQWGCYLQGVYEIHPPLALVGRYEHYDQAGVQPTVNLFVAGLAYKPRPWVVVKLEYLAADHPAEASPPGFKSSLAVLF